MVSADSVSESALRGSRQHFLTYLFGVAWLSLLLAEPMGLSLAFDTNIPSIVNHPSALPRLLALSSFLLRFLICVITVSLTALLFSSRFRQDLRDLIAEYSYHRLVPRYLTGHLAVYAVFFALTKWLIENIAQAGNQNVRVLAWVLCGLGVLVTWCLAAMPPRFWIQVLRRSWPVLLAGCVVGVFALGLGLSTGSLWGYLHRLTFQSVRVTLQLFTGEVVCQPEIFELGLRGFVVSIAPQCSGFEGIGLIWAFLGAYLLLFRKELRFPQALILIPIGTVVIWSFNVLRLVVLLLLGGSGHRDVAVGGFHSQAGWLAFNIVGLGLVAISRRYRLFSKGSEHDDVPPDTPIPNPTACYLGPMLAIVATSMITAAISSGQFDTLYPARLLSAGVALWVFRKGYSALIWSWSWPAVAIGILVFALWMALEPLYRTAADRSHTIADALSTMPGYLAAAWLACRVFGSVVFVPLAEELAFRGYLTRRLIAADFESVPQGRFTWPSFLVSSLLFGAMHQRWVAGTIAGMLYALAVYHRGRLSDAMLAHATTNALIACLVLMNGSWSLWM